MFTFSEVLKVHIYNSSNTTCLGFIFREFTGIIEELEAPRTETELEGVFGFFPFKDTCYFSHERFKAILTLYEAVRL